MLEKLSRLLSGRARESSNPLAKGVAPEDPVAAMIPEHSIAAYVGGTAEQFRFVGEFNLQRMVEFARLSPGERVLEIGCGIGRIAIALTSI